MGHVQNIGQLGIELPWQSLCTTGHHNRLKRRFDMLIFCIALYFVVIVPLLALLWASLVVAKWDDKDRGYEILDDQELELAL